MRTREPGRRVGLPLFGLEFTATGGVRRRRFSINAFIGVAAAARRRNIKCVLDGQFASSHRDEDDELYV